MKIFKYKIKKIYRKIYLDAILYKIVSHMKWVTVLGCAQVFQVFYLFCFQLWILGNLFNITIFTRVSRNTELEACGFKLSISLGQI